MARETGAWEEFVRRSRPAILRGAATALRKFRVADRDTLEDVHQQVFTELLREGGRVLQSYRGKSDLEGWLAVIALRTAYHLLRKRMPETELAEFMPETATPAPGERAERTEFLDRLQGAFGKMDAQDVKLLRLSFYEKKTYKEIAEALKIPLNSVSPTLIRAKEKLKRLLE